MNEQITQRPRDLIPCNEAAAELGISRGHMRRWILKGKIQGWHSGKKLYVSRAELAALWKPVVKVK